MKFLPSFSPLALVPLALLICSCANPANRRELYNTSQADSGPWHDYERRREAEAETGVSGGTAPTVLPGTRGRPTTPPPASNLPAGTSPAPTGAPAAVQGAEAGAPPAPVNPPAPAVVATPAPDAAAPAATPDVAAPAAPAATPAAP